jgi:hypothetical protein
MRPLVRFIQIQAPNDKAVGHAALEFPRLSTNIAKMKRQQIHSHIIIQKIKKKKNITPQTLKLKLNVCTHEHLLVNWPKDALAPHSE